jgi:dTDP-4-dehydrorhamnose reductase
LKVLVLGANSQLGQAVCNQLKAAGVDYQAKMLHSVSLHKKSEIIKVCSTYEPTVVMNVATFGNIESVEKDPKAAELCELVNSIGVQCLAEVCLSLELPLIHHSSAYVFDGSKSHPYKEEDSPNPQNYYGRQKWYGERAIRELAPRHIILRTEWLFSHQRPDYFFNFIDLVKSSNSRLTVSRQRFSPTPVDDAARVLLAIAQQIDCEAQAWGTYHYASLQPSTQSVFLMNFMQDAALYDTTLAERIQNLSFIERPVERPYITNSTLHAQKIFDTFGIKPRSRQAEINAVIQRCFNLIKAPELPFSPTPDKGDLADREEDLHPAPQVKKRT